MTTPCGLGLTLIFETVGADSAFSCVVSFCEQPLATIAKMATAESADRNACLKFEFMSAASVSSSQNDGCAEVYYSRKQKKGKEMKRKAEVEADRGLRAGQAGAQQCCAPT